MKKLLLAVMTTILLFGCSQKDIAQNTCEELRLALSEFDIEYYNIDARKKTYCLTTSEDYNQSKCEEINTSEQELNEKRNQILRELKIQSCD